MNAKKSEKKQFVIYTRCSTDDQAQGDYTTLDAQAHHCKNMLDAFGYKLAKFGNKGIVNDDGYSGKDLNRPGIQSILTDTNKKRSFDGIIFFRLDRLTRNPRDLYSLIDLFRDNDIDFISVRENLDSSTAIGRVVIGILGLLSAFERELTGERVKASAIARVRQGKWVGGQVPFGYKLINNGDPLPNGNQPHKLVHDEKIAPYIKLIYEMAADNKSLTRIGQELSRRSIKTTNGKQWRRQGISTIIKSPFYKGYLKYNGELHKGNHPAIVDENLWGKANRILTARLPGHKFVQKPRQYEYLLAGLIKCGECGSNMLCNFSAGRGKKRFFYYECSRTSQALGCSNLRISATAFDQAIIDYFKRASKDQEIIIRAIGNAILDSQIKLEKIEKILKDKESKFNELKHQSRQILELAIKNTIIQGSTYKDKMSELETEIAKLESDIGKLQAQKKVAQMDVSSGDFLYSNIRIAMPYMDKAPVEAQKSLIRALIKNIIVYDNKIAINMYIGDVLPNTLSKEKRPGKKSGALTTNQVSADCPIWLPAVYPESVLLWRGMRLKMTRELKRHTRISLLPQMIPITEAQLYTSTN